MPRRRGSSRLWRWLFWLVFGLSEMKTESNSFFEKKNQKTFVCLCARRSGMGAYFLVFLTKKCFDQPPHPTRPYPLLFWPFSASQTGTHVDWLILAFTAGDAAAHRAHLRRHHLVRAHLPREPAGGPRTHQQP